MERDDAIQRLAIYRAAIEETPAAIVLSDCDGVELTRSKAAAALLNGGAAAVLSGPVLRNLMNRAATASEGLHEIVEAFGPPRRTLSLTAVPLPISGTRRPVVALIEDTTVLQRAELARRDLVTNISHELRTPVGAVALLAETIAGEDDPATIRRLAGRLEIEATRLTSMLEDALALSRLEAAGTTDRQDLDLSELIRFCVARLRPTAETVAIELIADDVESGLVVHGDRALIMTAIDNLLDNAVKYSDKGRPVQVVARRVISTDQRQAVITITDHGIGIPMRERQRIFERFYRVDRARSRDTGGSGIGLAIVRHVAVSHDGQVEVDSLEGTGSTFTLKLPLVEQENS